LTGVFVTQLSSGPGISVFEELCGLRLLFRERCMNLWLRNCHCISNVHLHAWYGPHFARFVM